MTSRDPYHVLGIPRSATAAETKTAYRRLAMQRHPDTGGSHDQFVELTAAYEYVRTRIGHQEPARDKAAPRRRRGSTSSGGAPPPPRETFDEFMARTRGDRERFAKEQEEYFRRMHARAPFQLLWWRLSDAFRTAARDLAILLSRAF